MRGAVVAASLAAVVALGAASPAGAHGIWGHIHVTGWAMENLPAGELQEFLSDPEVFNAALFGAAFTDSGYWPQGGALGASSRAYSEHTHWEPFVQDFVAWIREHDPPPWDSLESRKRVAFLLGCASHGLQDEVFDSLFLFQVHEHDAGGQEEADPGTDGFMALDGHIRFVPEPYLPMDTLLELYQKLDKDVTEEVIQDSVDLMTFVYVNEAGREVALGLGEQYRDRIPWSHDHFLDPQIPGSLVSEIGPTMAYQQALWDRLHGDFTHDDLVVHAFPQSPRRLLGSHADSPDSWVTLVSGIGMKVATADLSWQDAAAQPVPFSPDGTRWGGLGTWSRLARLYPSEDLTPGGWYTVGIGPGVELMDGSTYEGSWSFDFQAPCDGADESLCPDPGEIAVPVIDGSGSPPSAEQDAEPDVSEDAAGAEPDGIDSDQEVGPATDAATGTAAETSPSGGCAGGSDSRHPSAPLAPLGWVLCALAAGLASRRWAATAR